MIIMKTNTNMILIMTYSVPQVLRICSQFVEEAIINDNHENGHKYDTNHDVFSAVRAEDLLTFPGGGCQGGKWEHCLCIINWKL